MKKPSHKLLAGFAAGLAGLAWVGFTAAIAATQRKLIFNPVRVREVQRPRSLGHRTRPVVLRSADGTRLSGWLLSPQAPGPHPAIVYFGGRSEEVSWVARDAGRMFPDMTVLAINYRGYGESTGIPGESQMMADAYLLFDWLAQRRHVDPARIGVVGRSLGSGIALQVAAHRPAAALVLITPYDSLVSIAKRRFRSSLPISWVMRHRFESIKYAPTLNLPTLVVRAASDLVIPASHTDLLVAKLANPPKEFTVPDSDHCTIPYLAATQECVAEFLASTFKVSRAQPMTPASNPRANADSPATVPAATMGLVQAP